MSGEPFSDYIPLPIVPLLLLVQTGALFVPDRRRRWALTAGCIVAIIALSGYFWSLPAPEPGEGADIGSAVLLLEIMASFVLLCVGVIREVAEVVEIAVRRLITRYAKSS